MAIPAIILAAGASRRLGQPKQLINIGGQTLLALSIRAAIDAEADPVFVVLGAHAEVIAGCLDLGNVHIIQNREWEKGIASSIHAGIRELDDICPAAALFVVCDQPRLTAIHLRSLLQVYKQAGEQTIVASRYAGLPGIPAIFPAEQFHRLKSLRGDAGARTILRNPECPLLTVEFEGGEVDIDTPDDLAASSDA